MTVTVCPEDRSFDAQCFDAQSRRRSGLHALRITIPDAGKIVFGSSDARSVKRDVARVQFIKPGPGLQKERALFSARIIRDKHPLMREEIPVIKVSRAGGTALNAGLAFDANAGRGLGAVSSD